VPSNIEPIRPERIEVSPELDARISAAMERSGDTNPRIVFDEAVWKALDAAGAPCSSAERYLRGHIRSRRSYRSGNKTLTVTDSLYQRAKALGEEHGVSAGYALSAKIEEALDAAGAPLHGEPSVP
jgi:hypothetical protein